MPQAAELDAICREFALGAAEATPAQRRAILEALEVVVVMQGRDYTIRGLVPELTRRGTLGIQAAGVHTARSLARRGARSATSSGR